MLNEYKNSTNLMFLGPRSQQSCPYRKSIEPSETLILIKKSDAVKSKEGCEQTGSPIVPIFRENN